MRKVLQEEGHERGMVRGSGFFKVKLGQRVLCITPCSDANLLEVPVEVENPDHHYYHIWPAVSKPSTLNASMQVVESQSKHAQAGRVPQKAWKVSAFPSSHNQFGISPPIWLSERSKWNSLELFLMLGKLCSLQEANFNMCILGKEDKLDLRSLVSMDKVLYERSRLVRFTSLLKDSSGIVSVRLLNDRRRIVSLVSLKKDLGTGPSKLLPLKSSAFNKEKDAFLISASRPLKWLSESSILRNDARANGDDGMLPVKEL
ncbi:hypothetical protein RJ640_010246 [Escallonia rubra]|uniref:Uncharacterized protein n=1 Tax=Escallonia rubra TaxID=112253 RepID=A0AA88QS49_9ASTE|nr:hypothetical protein RJ640_010246 [Escallonia rubra]